MKAKVLFISASKTHAFVAVEKPVGPFMSRVADGNIKIEDSESCKVGSEWEVSDARVELRYKKGEKEPYRELILQ